MANNNLFRLQVQKKVAKEAAYLLYRRAAENYLSAKQAAARDLKACVLPTNSQVALELDNLATEIEGPSRDQLLISFRQHGLRVMRLLRPFQPRLIGSVWRGTARYGSDVDLEAFCDTTQLIINRLQTKYRNLTQILVKKTISGRTDHFLHIRIPVSPTCTVNISVKRPDQIKSRRICEVYNDVIMGLTYSQLQKVLEIDPLQRFLPKER